MQNLIFCKMISNRLSVYCTYRERTSKNYCRIFVFNVNVNAVELRSSIFIIIYLNYYIFVIKLTVNL